MALEHGRLPDPVKEAIEHVLKNEEQLAERLQRIEEILKVTDTPSHATKKKGKTAKQQDMAHG